MVEKLLDKRATGGNKFQVDTVKGWFRSDEEGDAEDAIREMLRNPKTPVEGYGGGARDNIRLTSIRDGLDFLEAHGYDTDKFWYLD